MVVVPTAAALLLARVAVVHAIGSAIIPAVAVVVLPLLMPSAVHWQRACLPPAPLLWLPVTVGLRGVSRRMPAIIAISPATVLCGTEPIHESSRPRSPRAATHRTPAALLIIVHRFKSALLPVIRRTKPAIAFPIPEPTVAIAVGLLLIPHHPFPPTLARLPVLPRAKLALAARPIVLKSTKAALRARAAILLESPHLLVRTDFIPIALHPPAESIPVESSLPSPLLLHLAAAILASIALVELLLHLVQLSGEFGDLRFQLGDRLRVYALALITIAHAFAPRRKLTSSASSIISPVLPPELPKLPWPEVAPAIPPAKLGPRPAPKTITVVLPVPAMITGALRRGARGWLGIGFRKSRRNHHAE